MKGEGVDIALKLKIWSNTAGFLRVLAVFFFPLRSFARGMDKHVR